MSGSYNGDFYICNAFQPDNVTQLTLNPRGGNDSWNQFDTSNKVLALFLVVHKNRLYTWTGTQNKILFRLERRIVVIFMLERMQMMTTSQGVNN